MTPITKQQVEELIDRLASKELTFGCIVRARGVGIWQQSASLFYYRAVEEMSLRPDAADQRSVYCGFKPYSKVKFSCCGFQQYLQGWKEINKYPKTIEVYKPLLGSGYKVAELADVHEGKLEILGHPILIGDVLEKIAATHSLNESNLDFEGKALQLIRLWRLCGFTKSLQSIFAEAEWEEVAVCECGAKYTLPASPSYDACWESHHHILLKVPEQPAIRELFESLIKLGL